MVAVNNRVDQDWLIVLHLDGIRPRACPRPRFGGHAFMPSDIQALKADILRMAVSQGVRKVSGWVEISIEAIFERPKKPKDKRPTASDVDNLAKLVMDSLKDTVFDDDRYVAIAHFSKRYGTRDGYIVKLRQAPEPEVTDDEEGFHGLGSNRN